MIGEIVARLIAAGCTPDVAAIAVTEAFALGASATSPPTSADSPLERRRAYDRERMRKKRECRPTSADSPPTSETALILKKDKNKKVRATKYPCPPTWQPNQKHFEYAERLNIPRSAVEAKAEDMRIWAGSTGTTKVDWDLTFLGFLRRDAPKLATSPPIKLVEQSGFYAAFSSPQLIAWEAYERVNGKKYPRDKAGGWRFPAEWPPGHQAVG